MDEPAARDPRPASEGGEGDPAAITREAFEVWNQEGLEACAERFWHPDIVWEEAEEFPDSAVRRGRGECVRRMRERLSLLGHVELHPVEITATGERVVVEVTVAGKGAASGVPTEMREYFVFDNRGTQTIRFREFLDRDSALAAFREG